MRTPATALFLLVTSISFAGTGRAAGLEGTGTGANPDTVAVAPLVSDARMRELEHEAGPADEQLELALAYDERRDRRAVALYAKLAASGVGAAELRLGALSETGESVPQSYDDARTHYERAIAMGVQEANLRLGLLYLEGWGVARNPVTAVHHIEQAATAGYRPAQQVLSDMYFAGVGVGADATQALKWAELAAANQTPDAQLRVGTIHLKAVKLPQDVRVAREWFQLSAEQDYSRGMLAMAATFFRPGTDPESAKVGLRWLDLAADAGNSAAAFHRAGFHLMALSPVPSAEAVTRARQLLQQSAAAGEPAAREVLELEKEGRGLADAFRFVVSVPYDDRYVQHLAGRPDQANAQDHPPRPLKIARPIYPAALRLTKVEGDTLVEFVVDTTGRVRDAKIVSSSHPGFSDLSVAAVSTWRFLPGTKAGRAVNTRMRIPVQFRMSDVVAPNRAAAGQQ
ncbi:MAG: TonB family protein [Opitutus sp.]